MSEHGTHEFFSIQDGGLVTEIGLAFTFPPPAPQSITHYPAALLATKKKAILIGMHLLKYLTYYNTIIYAYYYYYYYYHYYYYSYLMIPINPNCLDLAIHMAPPYFDFLLPKT